MDLENHPYIIFLKNKKIVQQAGDHSNIVVFLLLDIAIFHRKKIPDMFQHCSYAVRF